MNMHAPNEQSTAPAYPALLLALSMTLPGSSSADTSIICSEIADNDRTRAVVEMNPAVYEFEIVTPEHSWSAPDIPRGYTDVSPNLVGRTGVYVTPTKDADGRLRVIDFGVQDPDALEMEGLRGSLMLHEGFLNNRAFGSLFYTATGNLVSVTALVCEYFSDP